MANEQMVEFFPGSDEPVPFVLTPAQAVRFLQLDDDGRALKDAVAALDRLVGKGEIIPVIVGKRRRYSRSELIRYIDDSVAKRSEQRERTAS